jgi:hypothetical protein
MIDQLRGGSALFIAPPADTQTVAMQQIVYYFETGSNSCAPLDTKSHHRSHSRLWIIAIVDAPLTDMARFEVHTHGAFLRRYLLQLSEPLLTFERYLPTLMLCMVILIYMDV